MIFCFANQKGGVGKTTVAVFLSQFFSFIKNQRVLIIDSDPQANTTRALIEYKGSPTLKELIIEGENIDNAILSTKINNLHLIPSSEQSLYALERYLLSEDDGPYKFKDLVEDYKLNEKFDMVFVDTPPNLGRLTVAALAGARYVIVPLESRVFSADAFLNLSRTIERTKDRFNDSLDLLGAFINKYEKRTNLSKSILESYRKNLGDILMQSVIRYNITIEECIGLRENLFIYDPRSNGAQDFAMLGDEILIRLVNKGALLSGTLTV